MLIYFFSCGSGWVLYGGSFLGGGEDGGSGWFFFGGGFRLGVGWVVGGVLVLVGGAMSSLG